MLFAAVSCVIGMVVAGGLLSPAGEQTQMRANAGISFICKLNANSLHLFPFPVTDTGQSYSWYSSRLDGRLSKLFTRPKSSRMRTERKVWLYKDGSPTPSPPSILSECQSP